MREARDYGSVVDKAVKIEEKVLAHPQLSSRHRGYTGGVHAEMKQ